MRIRDDLIEMYKEIRGLDEIDCIIFHFFPAVGTGIF